MCAPCLDELEDEAGPPVPPKDAAGPPVPPKDPARSRSSAAAPAVSSRSSARPNPAVVVVERDGGGPGATFVMVSGRGEQLQAVCYQKKE